MFSRLIIFFYHLPATVFPELSHIFFPDGLFGNKENSGFIFVRPTLQCFQNLQPPSPPFLVALLIHKWEIPWAKVFPLRLVLRLGYQYGGKLIVYFDHKFKACLLLKPILHLWSVIQTASLSILRLVTLS